jgi:hypothetical protein
LPYDLLQLACCFCYGIIVTNVPPKIEGQAVNGIKVVAVPPTTVALIDAGIVNLAFVIKVGESSVANKLSLKQAGIVAEYKGPPTAVVVVVVVIPVTVQSGNSLNLAVFNARAPPTTANTAIAVKMIFAFFIILFVHSVTNCNLIC